MFAVVFLFPLLAVPLLASVVSAPGSAVQTFALAVESSVWDVTSEDVNADGAIDIVAFACDDQSDPLAKSLAIFFADTAHRYREAPDFALPLDATISAAFFAEIDGAAPKELVTCDHAGAVLYRFVNNQYTRIGESAFDSLLPSGSKEPLFLASAAKDLDGDGIDEWIIPGDLGYQIRNANGLIASVACDIRSEFQRWASGIVEHGLPAVDTFTLPGESRKGLAFLSDRFADFAYGPNWSEHKRYRIPVELDDKWDSNAKMKDIDGNGFPDLVVTQMKGTIKIQCQTQVYLSKEPFTYPDEPSISFETTGAITAPFIEDVNGDNKQDLIFASIPFGVRSVVNFLVRNKVTVRAEVHLFDQGKFPVKPSDKTSFTLDAPDGREQIAFTMGDFTGDGLMDAAIGAGQEELDIHPGSKDAFITAQPAHTIQIPTFGIARTHDLNNNPKKDIIIYHLGGEHRKRVEVIVF